MKSLGCPNQHCPPSGKGDAGAIIRHGFYTTRWGKRCRYRCQDCGKTFCSTTGTPYHRLQHRRGTFDEVAALSVEGLNKSAIARVKRIAWNTVHRWLERAAAWSRRFSALFRDVFERMIPGQIPLITTDGFEFYKKVIGRVFGPACLYGQVIKTRRSDRIVKVERRIVIGGTWGLQQALRDSEDSSKLNTSFVERLNLTIRQGSAYLGRRTICQARWKQRLEDHLELFRCYYNFIRPHRALKFGREVRTPAMQAGLTRRQLTFREIFEAGTAFLESKYAVLMFTDWTLSVSVTNRRIALAA
jgi:transposase-like protein